MENENITAKLLKYYEQYNRGASKEIFVSSNTGVSSLRPSSRTSLTSSGSRFGSYRLSSAVSGLGYGIELI